MTLNCAKMPAAKSTTDQYSTIFPSRYTVNRDPVCLHRYIGRGNAKQLPCMHAATSDITYDEIAFGYLHHDLVCLRCSDRKMSAACFMPSRSSVAPGAGGLCATKSSARSYQVHPSRRLYWRRSPTDSCVPDPYFPLPPEGTSND